MGFHSNDSFVCIDLTRQAVDLEAVSDYLAILFVELYCIVKRLSAHCLTNDCVILVFSYSLYFFVVVLRLTVRHFTIYFKVRHVMGVSIVT